MQVFLADDQPQVRSALRLILEEEPDIEVVGEATNAQELIPVLKKFRPDLLLLDWELPGLKPSPAQNISTLRRITPLLTIVALSGQLDARNIALKAGVEAFVSKSHPPEELLNVIRAVQGNNQPYAQIPVKKLMITDVITTTPEVTLQQAYQQMLRARVRRLPVIANSRLVGIITLNQITQNGSAPGDLVKQVMTKRIITVQPDTTAGDAAAIMAAKKISGLPVVGFRQKLLGIITESDIFRGIVEDWTQRRQ